MTRTIARITGLLAAALALTSAATAATLYTEANAASGNEVQIYNAGDDGSLQPTRQVSTGGLGTSAGLGNQGAIARSRDGRWLLAVNAGSNDVSVFATTRAGLALTDKVASGGTRPVSVTMHDDKVFVLNAGSNGNIAGFRLLGNGPLKALTQSVLPLSSATAGAAQISYAPDGEALVVTEKATNKISTYSVADGRVSGPVVHASNGATPFGFAFDRHGNLLVSEAFGGAANAAALSSYELEDDDDTSSLELISGSVRANQTAACWVVVAAHGRYAYVTNTGSGTITGYRVSRSGELARLTADGRTGVTGGGPTDAAVGGDGMLLYVLSPSIGQIVTFRVNGDGGVTRLGSAPGVAGSATGLVVSR